MERNIVSEMIFALCWEAWPGGPVAQDPVVVPVVSSAGHTAGYFKRHWVMQIKLLHGAM
jgi:hypothetical protein